MQYVGDDIRETMSQDPLQYATIPALFTPYSKVAAKT